MNDSMTPNRMQGGRGVITPEEFGATLERLCAEALRQAMPLIEHDPLGDRESGLELEVERSELSPAAKRVMVATIRSDAKNRRQLRLAAFAQVLTTALNGIGLHAEIKVLKRRRRKRSSDSSPTTDTTTGGLSDPPSDDQTAER